MMTRSIEKGRKLADLLFDRGAIQFGTFRLKLHEKNPDAPLSPFYINLRTPDNSKPGPLAPMDCEEIAATMWDLMIYQKVGFTAVTPIPNAGNPLVDALPNILPMPEDLKILRLSKIEENGNRRVVPAEGNVYQCEQVALWDDLVTKADTKFEAIKAVKDGGGNVVSIIVLVDRQQGGSRELAEAGYTVHSVFHIYDLLAYYHQSGCITQEKYRECLDYLALK